MIRAVVTTEPLVAGKPAELAVRLTNTGVGSCTNIVFKLGLPSQIRLVRGISRAEKDRLDAGESHTHRVRVLPESAGNWVVTSPNFAYRNRHGETCRESDFRTVLTVAEPAVSAAPEASFSVRLANSELGYHEWDTLRGRISNTGASALRDVWVSISGPVTVEPPGVPQELGTLAPGTSQDFSFHVRAMEAGRVPIHLKTAFTDESGRLRGGEETIAVRVPKQGKKAPEVHGTPPPEGVKVLYLTANPSDTDWGQFNTELREIRETLRLGQHRDRFSLEARVAVRARDIRQALLDVGPRIVHFSAHGAEDGRLYVENDAGSTSLLSVDGLARLFERFADTVECVIVNACGSEALAHAIVRHIDYVVGMRQRIGDKAAIEFSIGFYQGLAAGRPVDWAFELGTTAVHMRSMNGEQYRTPLLLRRNR